MRSGGKSKTIALLLAWLFWPALDFYLGNIVKGIVKLLTLGGLVVCRYCIDG